MSSGGSRGYGEEAFLWFSLAMGVIWAHEKFGVESGSLRSGAVQHYRMSTYQQLPYITLGRLTIGAGTPF